MATISGSSSILLLLSLLTTTTASPLQRRNIGGVRLCDQVNWGGNCWYGILPLNQCIALNSLYVQTPIPPHVFPISTAYLGTDPHDRNSKGKVLSFRPDEGTECYLMQDRCTSSDHFIGVDYDSTFTGDLSGLEWIADAESFLCTDLDDPAPFEFEMRNP